MDTGAINMNLVLKDISHEYAAEFTRWIADKQAIKYTLSKFLPLRDIQWVKSYITSLIEDSTTWDQTIIVDNVAIGYCGLSNLSKRNRSGEYFIIIGNRDYWNKGLGTLAGHKVLEHGLPESSLRENTINWSKQHEWKRKNTKST